MGINFPHETNIIGHPWKLFPGQAVEDRVVMPTGLQMQEEHSGRDEERLCPELIYSLILHSLMSNRLSLGSRESAVNTLSERLSQGRTRQAITN